MATVTTAPSGFPPDWSLADLQEHLGVPAHRLRLHPPPGAATERDALLIQSRGGRLCELVDGVLVEKTVGQREARLAFVLGHLLESFVEGRRQGVVYGDGALIRLPAGPLRIPDACFYRWERFPEGRIPEDPVLDVAPDLVIEVLSADNTPREMERKLSEYFAAGVRRAWYIDPKTRTVRVFSAPDQGLVVPEDGLLTESEILPGFELRLSELFARAERRTSTTG